MMEDLEEPFFSFSSTMALVTIAEYVDSSSDGLHLGDLGLLGHDERGRHLLRHCVVK